jgi:hypothetical protein
MQVTPRTRRFCAATDQPIHGRFSLEEDCMLCARAARRGHPPRLNPAAAALGAGQPLRCPTPRDARASNAAAEAGTRDGDVSLVKGVAQQFPRPSRAESRLSFEPSARRCRAQPNTPALMDGGSGEDLTGRTSYAAGNSRFSAAATDQAFGAEQHRQPPGASCVLASGWLLRKLPEVGRRHGRPRARRASAWPLR